MQHSPFTRFLAIVCALAFSVTAVAAALWVSVDRELLVSSTYKNALASQQVYQRLPGIVAEQLVLGLEGTPCAGNPLRCDNAKPELTACFKTALGERRYRVIAAGVEQPSGTESQGIQVCLDKIQPDLQTTNMGGGVLSFFRSIRARDLEKVITPLLPADQMKPLADSYLDQLFSTLNGRQSAITLDLTGIKKSLAGPGGLDTLLLIVRSQPQCSFQQLQELLMITLTGKGNLFLCNPSTDLLNLLTPFLQNELEGAVNLIPDKDVIIPLQVGTSRSFGPFGNGSLGAIRMSVTLLRLTPLLPLFFLLLLTLLVVRTFKDFLVWWGIPIFAAGLFLAAVGLTGAGLFEPAWVGLLTGRIPAGMSLGLVGTVHDLMRVVLQAYWQGIEIGGGLLVLAGLIMWIGSGFIRPHYISG